MLEHNHRDPRIVMLTRAFDASHRKTSICGELLPSPSRARNSMCIHASSSRCGAANAVEVVSNALPWRHGALTSCLLAGAFMLVKGVVGKLY